MSSSTENPLKVYRFDITIAGIEIAVRAVMEMTTPPTADIPPCYSHGGIPGDPAEFEVAGISIEIAHDDPDELKDLTWTEIWSTAIEAAHDHAIEDPAWNYYTGD